MCWGIRKARKHSVCVFSNLCYVLQTKSFHFETKQSNIEMKCQSILFFEPCDRAQNFNQIGFHVVKRQFVENKLEINFHIIPSFA